MSSYVIARMRFRGRGLITALLMSTLFIPGIALTFPVYNLVNKLGLYNTLWALILPGCLSIYNAIIMKTAMEAVPESLSESAYIDGANDLVVLFRILVPLIIPTLAVILLYYGVGHWNSWFPATVYLEDNIKLPIQAVLRSIVIENETLLGGATEVVEGEAYANDYTETIKYAVIVISTIPILCVYPFLQRFFVKGVMIGAVKG